MSEYSELGWVVTIAARERAGRGRTKERLVRVQSRRTDRLEAEREAKYTFLNDLESWVSVEALEIAGTVRVVPGPRQPMD